MQTNENKWVLKFLERGKAVVSLFLLSAVSSPDSYVQPWQRVKYKVQ